MCVCGFGCLSVFFCTTTYGLYLLVGFPFVKSIGNCTNVRGTVVRACYSAKTHVCCVFIVGRVSRTTCTTLVLLGPLPRAVSYREFAVGFER